MSLYESYNFANTSKMKNHSTRNTSGCLYIVATPIGNLADITQRAIETLQAVDCVLAEDTRHSQILLKKLGIQKPMVSLHEHNERQQAAGLCQQILTGTTVALISDAGTPLISDPGFHLVRLAQEQGIRVVPIPGASALLAALSVSGLPTDCFIFQGFLPGKSVARRKQLEQLKTESKTLIFYEAPHRILESLVDMVEIFGESREAVIARELTKTFETIRRSSLIELLHWVQSDKDQTRGEIVILVAGAAVSEINQEINEDVLRTLKILLQELSVKQSAHILSKMTGIPKNKLYDLALTLKL